MSTSDLQLSVKLDASEAYSRWAPTYDQTPNPLTALEERLVAPMLSEFASRDVVDLGCGTGRWLLRLEPVGPRSLVGIDSSSAMLTVARKKCTLSTSLIEADCASTPLATCSVDLVLASFLLSYVGDIGRFSAEAARVLRPGGTLIVSDLHPDTPSYGWRRTFRAADGLFEIATFPYALSALHSGMKDVGLGLDQLDEVRFGEDEAAIFRANDMAQHFHQIQHLPVMWWARFSRS